MLPIPIRMSHLPRSSIHSITQSSSILQLTPSSPHPPLFPSTLSSPNTLALPINNAPTYPPKNRISPACTAVIRTRFSVSARCAFSCASCACRCAYWRALLDDEPVELERDEEGRDREAEAEVPVEPEVELVDCVGRDILLI